ncbi:MAG: sulfite exporter TauE/SafE family protein [Candidatus Omnitrophota bacterium]
MYNLLYLILGLVAGILSGFLGIGGGTIIIPVLVYLFGLTQHQAQGTTLAIMIPPVGLLAALVYYRQGNVIIPIAIWAALGFFLGGYLGAQWVMPVPDLALKRIFGVFLAVIGLRMILAR